MLGSGKDGANDEHEAHIHTGQYSTSSSSSSSPSSSSSSSSRSTAFGLSSARDGLLFPLESVSGSVSEHSAANESSRQGEAEGLVKYNDRLGFGRSTSLSSSVASSSVGVM